MRSPYGRELDSYPDRTIYLEEEQLITQGYEFIGWANGWGKNRPELLNKHINAGHDHRQAFPYAVQAKQHTPSGDDITQWCSICRIYWKVDAS